MDGKIAFSVCNMPKNSCNLQKNPLILWNIYAKLKLYDKPTRKEDGFERF